MQRLRDRIRVWLVEGLPKWAEAALQPLNRWQMMVMVVCLFLLYVPLITMRVTAWEQGAVAIVFIALGVTLVRLESDQPDSATSESLHLFLLTLSSLMTLRYLYYRTTYTLNFDGVLNSVFTLLLYVAELYAIATLFLSYFQTLKIRDRTPVSLTPIPVKDWLKVDIYIPTYNEDVEIVRKTVLGAIAIDYPPEKKRSTF